MIAGVIVRITAAGGFAANPPGSIAACVGDQDTPPLGVFVFQNGAAVPLTWTEFQANTAVVGYCAWLHGVLAADAVLHMANVDRREIFAGVFRGDWPATDRRSPALPVVLSDNPTVGKQLLP